MADDAANDAPAPSGKSSAGRVAANMIGLSPWKKWLLSVFLVMASVGSVAWTHAKLTMPAPSATVTSDDAPAYLRSDPTPENSAGLLGDAPARSADPGGTTLKKAQAPELPWHGRMGGWFARLGISFAVGLLVGVFFRSFLKTMAALTAVAVAAIVALSYFEILDIDTANMRANYDSAAGWASGQIGGVKDFVMGYLPSVTASGLGFAVGFLRR